MIIYGVDVRCHYDNGNVRVAHRYTNIKEEKESGEMRERRADEEKRSREKG